jgi:YfiH family protein
VIVAVSERGTAPLEAESPTAFLARAFAADLGHPDLPLARATQVHGNRVGVVTNRPAQGETVDAGRCDALVTQLTGVGLVVQTADCVPVLFAGESAIGAVHAGWRGSAAGVVEAALEAFLPFAGDPTSVRAWLGPSIGPCCYEVGEEVATRFPPAFARPSEKGRFLFDLAGVVTSQLVDAGILRERVAAHQGCTKCGGERFASYRRDREKAGRMIALVARLG